MDRNKYSKAKRMAGGGEVEEGQDRAHPSSAPAFGGFFDRLFARKKSESELPPVEDRTPTPVKRDEPAKGASDDEVKAQGPSQSYEDDLPTEKDVKAATPKRSAPKRKAVPKKAAAPAPAPAPVAEPSKSDASKPLMKRFGGKGMFAADKEFDKGLPERMRARKQADADNGQDAQSRRMRNDGLGRGRILAGLKNPNGDDDRVASIPGTAKYANGGKVGGGKYGKC
jgi:outer membrane biosynthesis protein TonB